MPNTITIEPNGIYGSSQLSAMLDVSEETLSAARRAGSLRWARKGRRVLYLGEWVLDWLRREEGSCDQR